MIQRWMSSLNYLLIPFLFLPDGCPSLSRKAIKCSLFINFEVGLRRSVPAKV